MYCACLVGGPPRESLPEQLPWCKVRDKRPPEYRKMPIRIDVPHIPEEYAPIHPGKSTAPPYALRIPGVLRKMRKASASSDCFNDMVICSDMQNAVLSALSSGLTHFDAQLDLPGAM
jgi:hypothetical protein